MNIIKYLRTQIKIKSEENRLPYVLELNVKLMEKQAVTTDKIEIKSTRVGSFDKIFFIAQSVTIGGHMTSLSPAYLGFSPAFEIFFLTYFLMIIKRKLF